MLSLEVTAYPPIASRENTPVPVRVTRVRDVTSASLVSQLTLGGVEYFMNRGWGHLQFSCYGSDA